MNSKEQLELLNKLTDKDFDWEQYDGDSVEVIFRKCYFLHDYKTSGYRPVSTISCGSAGFLDTPKTLYRLLYLFEPVNTDFSDMFKSETVFEICSDDYNYCCSIQFYKYQLGAYFHCAEKFHNNKMSRVMCGWPGADNSCACISEIGNVWFNTLIKCLNYEYRVYPGNSFVV